MASAGKDRKNVSIRYTATQQTNHKRYNHMKPKMHFTDNYIINPTNPIIINLIGTGGTGSQVLSSLARINISLLQLGHPGIFVRAFDDDIITAANIGRQLFASSEIGLCKSVALINRLNRFFGTNWKAIPQKFDKQSSYKKEDEFSANITISCTDSVVSRFDIAAHLKANKTDNNVEKINRPIYWMDYGNERNTGQVILSTVEPVIQPSSNKFIGVGTLPFVTEEFKEMLLSTDDNNAPSCSLAEALQKQNLCINSTLAALGSSLLWKLFREGMTECRGFFLNLKEFRTQPLSL